jgi:RNA polymerase sigma factor (sigma-70 family)
VTSGPAILLDHLRRTLAAPAAGRPDGELLRLFTLGGPSAGPAFEALVRRHGPLVWRACRAVLGDTHDAEDAFQATFLVLVHKARSLRRPEALGPWLFAVARHVAARARDGTARRRAHERRAAASGAVSAPSGLASDEAALVHAEVGRLPEGLRAAVVLCDLQGLTYEEAAGRLGVSHATLRGRLARARERLRRRLARCGLGPDGLALAPVAVPRALVRATARSAAFVAGSAGGAVPESVLLLMKGGLMSMAWTKLKAAGLCALAASILAAGALGLSAQAPAPVQEPPRSDNVLAQPVFPPAGTLVRLPERASPADRILRLANEARRLDEGDDPEGALRALRQLDDAAWAWQGDLRRRRGGPAAGGAAPAAQSQPRPVLPNQPAGAADLESRLREVEKKLDRLLKALDGPKSPVRNPPGGLPK